jgi:hypothetical protein
MFTAAFKHGRQVVCHLLLGKKPKPRCSPGVFAITIANGGGPDWFSRGFSRSYIYHYDDSDLELKRRSLTSLQP